MDIFCEYMVKRKKGAKEIGITAGLVFAAIFISLLLIVFLRQYSFAFICGTWYGAWWLIRRTDKEFEYILTSAILDIDKIMAKSSRKRILSVDLTGIYACRPVDDATEEAGKVIDASPNGAEDGVYAIDFEKNDQKKRLLFKPDKKMLNQIKKASPSLVTLRTEDIEG